MAICRIYEIEGATTDQYDVVDAKFPDMPSEAHIHVAGVADGSLYVVEVWDSQEAVERYMEQIGPEIEAAGIPEPTKVTEFEVHNEVRGS